MSTNADLVSIIAKTLGLDREHVDAIAQALSIAAGDEGTIATAVDLVIASLAAATPEEASRRLELYRALPLTHGQWLNCQAPNRPPQNLCLEVEDFPILPGAGPRVAAFSRSLWSALVQYLEQRIKDAPAWMGTPYMLKIARRDTAPLAFIGTMGADRSEEILLFRNTEDAELSYAISSYRLTLYASAHGHVLDAIADLFRGERQRPTSAKDLAAPQSAAHART